MSQYSCNSPMRNRVSNNANSHIIEDSPNPKKLLEVNEKFNHIIQVQDNERKNKSNQIENFINNLEKEINSNNQFEHQMKGFREEISTIQENLIDEKNMLENFEEKYYKEIQNYENFMKTKFEEDKHNRVEDSDRILKMTEDKSFQISNSLDRNIKELENKTNNKLNEIEDKIEEIKGRVDNEVLEREEGIVLINEQIEEETKKFFNRIVIENNIREETYDKMCNMIDDFNVDINNNIKKEKKIRTENNESILKLIEETCNKLDQKLRGYTY